MLQIDEMTIRNRLYLLNVLNFHVRSHGQGRFHADTCCISPEVGNKQIMLIRMSQCHYALRSGAGNEFVPISTVVTTIKLHKRVNVAHLIIMVIPLEGKHCKTLHIGHD